MPKLSIIIPVYNVEKYLPKCLESILGQSFKDFEIICVNDGSTDNSLQVLQTYKKQDGRIVIVDKKMKVLVLREIMGYQLHEGIMFTLLTAMTGSKIML